MKPISKLSKSNSKTKVTKRGACATSQQETKSFLATLGQSLLEQSIEIVLTLEISGGDTTSKAIWIHSRFRTSRAR